MKASEILQYIQKIESMYSYDGRYKTIYALVCSLPDDELMQFVEARGFPPVYMRVISRRGLEKTLASRQKSAVSRMLRLLSLPECKNKTQLRDGLKSRYAFVPKAYQQKILHCMLAQGTKKERLWSYSRLNLQWNESFAQSIERCFGEYHETQCASVIIRHFPLSYIYSHREELSSVIGYGYVIRRLAPDYPDLLKRDSLSDAEWIRTITDLHLHEYEDEIENYLYQTIAHEVEKLMKCETPYRYMINARYGNTIQQLAIRNFPGVGLAVWSMGQMRMADAILRFQEYDCRYEYSMPYNTPEEKLVEFFYQWLCDIYDEIAVGRLGWISREEKGLTIEMFLSSSTDGNINNVEDYNTAPCFNKDGDSDEDCPF